MVPDRGGRHYIGGAMGIEDQRAAWLRAHPEYLLPDGTVDFDKLCTDVPPPITASPSKRMSVSLPPDTAALLEQLAQSQGVTMVEAIRRAISTEAYLKGEIREGCRVHIVAADGTTKEVVFR